jgi:hypothetical protein
MLNNIMTSLITGFGIGFCAGYAAGAITVVWFTISYLKRMR